MKNGYLSQYFTGVAVKRLSNVEVDTFRSNQHEFNGVQELRNILGEPVGKDRHRAMFLYLTDDDEDPPAEEGFLTWYDARKKAREERGTMRCEHRLYFPSNTASRCAAVGDLLVIARRPDDTLLAIVAEKDSTIEQQILWLFGVSDFGHPGFSVRAELETEQDRIGFAARIVLDQIGVETDEQAPNYLDRMMEDFGGVFPTTASFSAFARSTISDLSSRDDPDLALVVWMDREEVLFRTLEKHLLGEELQRLGRDGIGDPEPFIKLVQSALQRRKSRAGSALENHLEQIFGDHNLAWTHGGLTENQLKPDFIFPGIDEYRNAGFPESRLTMLAAKSTCKDRWRQILNEAARIRSKHLLTLEPSISENQTGEMQNENVQLVVPESLRTTYKPTQQAWLMNVAAFVQLVQYRQNC